MLQSTQEKVEYKEADIWKKGIDAPVQMSECFD